MTHIKLTKAEIQSGLNRQRWAELLILQLPSTHEGRNSWLLNFGVEDASTSLRQRRGIKFNENTQAADTTS